MCWRPFRSVACMHHGEQCGRMEGRSVILCTTALRTMNAHRVGLRLRDIYVPRLAGLPQCGHRSRRVGLGLRVCVKAGKAKLATNQGLIAVGGLQRLAGEIYTKKTEISDLVGHTVKTRRRHYERRIFYKSRHQSVK